MSTHQPRSTARSLILVPFAVALLALALTFVAVDPGAALQIDPTAEPGTQFQANPTPTSTPDLPIRVSPTEPPPRDPGGFQANPTEAPPREPDDVPVNPTVPPTIDDVAIPTTGTVRVEKRACPAGVLGNALLTDYLEICTQPHDGVEFVVNDIDGAQAGVTSDGQIEWTGVDPGVFNIAETIPAGYGDPIVFCGYTESPGGGVQHPALQASMGGVVSGTFPDTTFEFVCYWMNVPADDGPGQGNGNGQDNADGGTVRVIKRDCPPGIAEDTLLLLSQALDTCTEPHDGVEFTLNHAEGSENGVTAGGEVEWTDVPLGDFEIVESLPDGYAIPIVHCGFTESPGGGVQHPAVQNANDEIINGSLMVDGSEFVCYWMNIKSGDGGFEGPGGVANPEGGDGDGGITVVKYFCPVGVGPGLTLYEYRDLCIEPGDGVEFTLANAEGESTKPISGSVAEWDGLPLGPFTVQEDIPVDSVEPVVFCSWTAFHDGAVYDGFAQLVAAPGGLIDREVVIPNTSMLCEFFNLQPESMGFTSPLVALEGRLS